MATRKLILSAMSLALAGASVPASATDVFRLEGYGAVSRAMGGVATASDVGPAGMLTNPATLSLMKEGQEVMLGLDLITTDIDVKNKTTGETTSSGTHANNRGPYLAPEVAYTKKVGPWAFGVGAFAQGGLGTEYGNNSFLSKATGGGATGLDNSSRLLVLNIPFAASFQVNDKLAIGGSVDAMWQGLNLNLLLGVDQVGSLFGASRVTDSGNLKTGLDNLLRNNQLLGAHFSLTKNQPLASGVSSWGHTERLGFVYKATADTTLGASYTFKSQMADMEGNATLTAVTATLGPLPFAGKIKIQDFQMPATLDLGISQRVSPQLTVAVDVSRVYWKNVMKDIKVAFVADVGGDINILLPQDYKDQTILALGGAYQWDDKLTLRGGLRFATQALQASEMFAVIPATPRTHISAGFGYAFSKQSKLDFAYSHAFQETMDNPGTPNTSAPIQVTHSQDNATINYTYSF